jgi:phosphatidylinositol 3-kinase
MLFDEFFSTGFVQFIQSTTVADVLLEHGTIQNFFKKNHPSETDPSGISSNVMDTYVKSCGKVCFLYT